MARPTLVVEHKYFIENWLTLVGLLAEESTLLTLERSNLYLIDCI
jgi:hypothetical protein